MILAIDTFYTEEQAHTVGLLFELLQADTEPTEILEASSAITSDYIPGQFYKRELPPIADLLENHLGLERLKAEVGLIIVDGFYNLWEGKPGLGHHLEDYLRDLGITGIEIMGIAKSKPRDGDTFAQRCLRGKHGTTNPLWVNGSIPGKNYSEVVKEMAGEYRLPEILKYLDDKTKYKK